ncbi:MAG: hypothetical protein GXO85_13345 [Chlorobi bacterium]|nr:hypothetical protein [Chlorobiota bacterium]
MTKYKLLKNCIKLISFFIITVSLFNSCSAPPIIDVKINDSNTSGNTKNEIGLITYNIKAVYGKSEVESNSLVQYLNNQLFDFVLLQEVFDEDAREYLIGNLDSSFYRSMIPRIDYNSFPANLCQDAGLFSKSKFPIVDLSNIDFGENTEISNGAIHQLLLKEFSISLDFLSNKSVMGVLYQVNDSTKLFLFSTHIQALSSKRHKINQLRQIQAFIQNAVVKVLRNKIVKFPENLIVLLTGDLNYDAYSESDFKILRENLGNPRDLYKEINDDLKEYSLIIKYLNLYKRVDYIFAYDNIGPIKLRKIGVKSINVTDITDQNKKSISDHRALKATLLLN